MISFLFKKIYLTIIRFQQLFQSNILKAIVYKTITYFFLLVIIYSCKSKPSTLNINKALSTVNSVAPDTNDFDQPGIVLDLNNVKVIDTLYVIDPNGVEVRSKPDVLSKVIIARGTDDQSIAKRPLKYQLGHQFLVLERKDGWLGVMEDITRAVKSNGQISLSTLTEKVYVQENHVGKLSEVKVPSNYLMILTPENEDDTSKKYLKGYLDLKLITKAEYEEKKATAIDNLVVDTAKIKSKDGVIELPLQKGIKRYKNSGEGENLISHNYFGQFPFLNAYLVSTESDATESGYYSLINKKDGSEIIKLNFFPHISYDKRYLIGIQVDIPDHTTAFELSQINGTNVKLILGTSFRYWFPVVEDDKGQDMFWATDGCFYLPIAHRAVIEQRGSNFQYLKITIL